ncbi:hypothetical protein VKT23_008687 [Stygiomarasmius scandens]|uniref:F-box domain-containing protein n=1 Tax=Marasmiellus scandens TaxID=2682957 RepID=A0ABR1JH41_9AGAR
MSTNATTSASGTTNNRLLCANCNANLMLDSAMTSADWVSFRSRIDLLLKSNDNPAPRELQSMQVCLASAESKVQNIEQQIFLLQQQREMLEKEKRELRRYIIDQRAVLNPIRRVPIEILTKIFTICVDSAIHSGWDNPLSTKTIRWAIGYTCRSWRAVSLNAPSLWSNIQVILDEHRAAFSSQARLLGLHVQRSKFLPLTIGLFSASYTANITPNHSFLAVLTPSVDRWQHLHLAMNPVHMQQCLSHIAPFFSSLESLTTSFTHDWDPSDNTTCDVFQDAGMLHEATLRYNVILMKLRWGNIRSLTLLFDSSPLRDILSTLRQMSKLETLQILYDSSSAPRANDPGTGYLPVRLSSLRTLRLTRLNPDNNEVNVRHLLSALVLPQLETFIDPELSVDIGVILSLLQWSKCTTLSHFETSAAISEDKILYILQNYPQIKILELCGVTSLTNTIINKLIYSSSSSCLLPLLEDLVLKGQMSFDAEPFVCMLESRFLAFSSGENISCMKKVSLQWLGDSLPMDIAAFERFEQPLFKGFDFDISCN